MKRQSFIKKLRNGFGDDLRGHASVTGSINSRQVIIIFFACLDILILKSSARQESIVELRPLIFRRGVVWRAINIIARDITLGVGWEEERDASGRGDDADGPWGDGRVNIARSDGHNIGVEALDLSAARAQGDGAHDVVILLAELKILIDVLGRVEERVVDRRLADLCLRLRDAVDVVAEQVDGCGAIYVGDGRLPSDDDGGLGFLRGGDDARRLADARGRLDQEKVGEGGALPGSVDVAQGVAQARGLSGQFQGVYVGEILLTVL